ncbi:MAG: hypothetical protein M0P91_10630 [Sulfuricurvum sp.]|jgi:hypothetical protein|uniref:hypothetical protein n=1 Tax=Sulfuricurvum sp. TaxID=2025608 RepID=UPI002600B13B|nr:hypothetical protein [Sulfuricurvum sp.]MCK9373645.1 hypothetical protein [Sulfuricurvum sp.]
MQLEQKKILQFALELDIKDVYTYSGYKGDLVVKITAKEKDVIVAIRKFALSLGIKEVVIKQNHNLVEYEIYCITQDDVYQLKGDRFKERLGQRKYVEDSWIE